MNRLLVGSVLAFAMFSAGCTGTTEPDVMVSAKKVADEKAETPALPPAETESKVESEAAAEPDSNVEASADTKNSTGAEDFDAGIAAYQANNLPLAFKSFQSASKKGHADSQFNLGLMYEQGIGTAKNESQAVAWYRESAAQGNSAAQFNLGVLYENGRGTKVDFAQANKWYRSASVQGDALAIGNLGMLYVRGDGVAENKVAGVALLMTSAMMDRSPDNLARRNITSTRGLSSEMIAAAQKLSGEMSSAKDLNVTLDQYLKESMEGTPKK